MIMKFIACLQRIWRAKVSEQQECCEHSYGAISHVPHSVCDTTSAHSEWKLVSAGFQNSSPSSSSLFNCVCATLSIAREMMWSDFQLFFLCLNFLGNFFWEKPLCRDKNKDINLVGRWGIPTRSCNPSIPSNSSGWASAFGPRSLPGWETIFGAIRSSACWELGWAMIHSCRRRANAFYLIGQRTSASKSTDKAFPAPTNCGLYSLISFSAARNQLVVHLRLFPFSASQSFSHLLNFTATVQFISQISREIDGNGSEKCSFSSCSDAISHDTA